MIGLSHGAVGESVIIPLIDWTVGWWEMTNLESPVGKRNLYRPSVRQKPRFKSLLCAQAMQQQSVLSVCGKVCCER